jgi:hypothetical protein
LDKPSVWKGCNDPPAGDKAEITARSSFNAVAETCADPTVIAPQIEASIIHAGSSRENLRFNSRCTT